MGTWDTNIDANDAFVDAFDCFFDTYNDGATAEAAAEATLDAFENSDADERIDIYFAMVLGLWETKSLTASHLAEVERIIVEGEDIARWRSLSATEEKLNERETHLRSFLAKISTPRKTKKRRKKQKQIYSRNVLLNLVAPDGKKVFNAFEHFLNGDYLATHGSMDWSRGGIGIFYHEKRDARIEGHWVDSQNLELVIYDQPVFMQQRVTFFQAGDSGEIVYLDDTGQKIVPDSLLTH